MLCSAGVRKPHSRRETAPVRDGDDASTAHNVQCAKSLHPQPSGGALRTLWVLSLLEGAASTRFFPSTIIMTTCAVMEHIIHDLGLKERSPAMKLDATRLVFTTQVLLQPCRLTPASDTAGQLSPVNAHPCRCSQQSHYGIQRCLGRWLNECSAMKEPADEHRRDVTPGTSCGALVRQETILAQYGAMQNGKLVLELYTVDASIHSGMRRCARRTSKESVLQSGRGVRTVRSFTPRTLVMVCYDLQPRKS